MTMVADANEMLDVSLDCDAERRRVEKTLADKYGKGKSVQDPIREHNVEAAKDAVKWHEKLASLEGEDALAAMELALEDFEATHGDKSG